MILHTIRINGKNELKEVKLTPIKAIKRFCKECMGFVFAEIEGCTDENCPLYPYRGGTRPIGFEKPVD